MTTDGCVTAAACYQQEQHQQALAPTLMVHELILEAPEGLTVLSTLHAVVLELQVSTNRTKTVQCEATGNAEEKNDICSDLKTWLCLQS